MHIITHLSPYAQRFYLGLHKLFTAVEPAEGVKWNVNARFPSIAGSVTDLLNSDGLSADQLLDRKDALNFYVNDLAWRGNVGVYYYVRVSFAARAMFLGDVETLRLLLVHGADPLRMFTHPAVNFNGAPLNFIFSTHFMHPSVTLATRLRLVEVLRECGGGAVDPNVRRQTGKWLTTPLHDIATLFDKSKRGEISVRTTRSECQAALNYLVHTMKANPSIRSSNVASFVELPRDPAWEWAQKNGFTVDGWQIVEENDHW